MSFKGDTVKLQDAVAMTSTSQSTAADAGPFNNWSMSFVWTGTPTGTVTVETSPNGTNWVTLSGSSQATGGAAGSFTVNQSGSGHRYIRGVYTFTSGTGSITTYFTGK